MYFKHFLLAYFTLYAYTLAYQRPVGDMRRYTYQSCQPVELGLKLCIVGLGLGLH